MTVVKSLLFKLGITPLSIWLFVFVGYLETFGVTWTYFCENLSTYSYPDQLSIVYTSKNIVRGRIKLVYEEEFNINLGARLGYRKWFSKSEDVPIILLVFIGVWGNAIIFVLGIILYRIVIEPIIKKRKLRRNERR